ncbi:MAG: right-handed parallel beta-helix repeat-containing protein [Thermoleophilia bacterium]|nr:right-handed parallel beta-helix repeat-containing protein [Thermoleophilia bacterium]
MRRPLLLFSSARQRCRPRKTLLRVAVVTCGISAAAVTAAFSCAEVAAATAGDVGRVARGVALPPVSVPYEIGSPVLRSIWVDPRSGNDGRSGRTRRQALRTLAAAWLRIPRGRVLTGTGYRIRITPGTLGAAGVPNYFESRHGTYRFPILIEAADGPGTVTLAAANIYDTRYLYLLGLRFASAIGDALHCEKCDHFLLRNSVVRGAPRASWKVGDLLKVNQSQHVYLESNDISGASDNAVDFVAVQYATILSNRIHDSNDWCAYVKGGSASVRVSGNEIYDCGTGGFSAGQGTGFQFMTWPWLQYEAYDVKVTNNVVHDVDGAGLGVNGGYAVLLAYNTLYRVGARDHLLEFVAGHRSCDGRPGDDGRGRCAAWLARRGFGTTRVDDGENYVRIPNNHVYVYDNLIFNPPGTQSRYMHIAVARPYAGEWQAGSNVPVPTRFDADLRFRGNVVWDGPRGHPSGLGGDAGCRDENSTCNDTRYRTENRVNSVRPVLVSPEDGDYALTTASAAALSARTVAAPAFRWADAPAGVPVGNLSNAVPRDRKGVVRGFRSTPGAYAG